MRVGPPHSAIRPSGTAPTPRAALTGWSGVPGPELPPIEPQHPSLPRPVPTLEQLAQLAAAAAPEDRHLPGSGPASLRNAHYSNTRSQLAYALTHPYNSVEGDVRVRGGRLVMQHDSGGRHDLTFEQWAAIARAAGKHLRIDVKEAAALPRIEAALSALRVPDEHVTFNVGVSSPFSKEDIPVDVIRALRDRHRAAWITLNLPVPGRLGYSAVSHAAEQIGRSRLGVAVLAEIARASDVAKLLTRFEAVNAWNVAQLGTVKDTDAMRTHLRAMGVNGMLDLRRSDDPLASP